MFRSQICRVRAASSSSQGQLKFFRLESESGHDLVETSHKILESIRVIGLQARVSVESNEI